MFYYEMKIIRTIMLPFLLNVILVVGILKLTNKIFKKDEEDVEIPVWYMIGSAFIGLLLNYLLFSTEIFSILYGTSAFLLYLFIGEKKFITPYNTFSIPYTICYVIINHIIIYYIYGFETFMMAGIGLYSILPAIIIALVCSKKMALQRFEGLTIISDEQVYEILGEDFNIEEFKQTVFNNFKKIQLAWTKGDIEPVRKYLIDELFNMERTQLLLLNAKKKKEVYKNINYKKCNICSINKIANKIEITVLLQVTCKHYTAKDGIITKGNKKDKHYLYKISFVKDLKKSKLKTCPNCGAKLENARSDKCEYCNTVIIKESTRFAMTDKKLLLTKETGDKKVWNLNQN